MTDPAICVAVGLPGRAGIASHKAATKFRDDRCYVIEVAIAGPNREYGS
jgi:hypothetical protein